MVESPVLVVEEVDLLFSPMGLHCQYWLQAEVEAEFTKLPDMMLCQDQMRPLTPPLVHRGQAVKVGKEVLPGAEDTGVVVVQGSPRTVRPAPQLVQVLVACPLPLGQAALRVQVQVPLVVQVDMVEEVVVLRTTVAPEAVAGTLEEAVVMTTRSEQVVATMRMAQRPFFSILPGDQEMASSISPLSAEEHGPSGSPSNPLFLLFHSFAYSLGVLCIIAIAGHFPII